MRIYILNQNNQTVDDFAVNFMGYGTKEAAIELDNFIKSHKYDLNNIMSLLNNRISKDSTGRLFYYLSKGYTLSTEWNGNPFRNIL